jgi:hypothetical protein
MNALLSTNSNVESATWQNFERLYAIDLVYVRDCWQLCGDAHCCSFSRYKSKFRLLARTPFQELPLLPHEYDYLEAKGWLAQFGDFDRKTTEYPLANYTLKIDSIISRRPHCACDHATRPIVCRLYPLLPVFNLEGVCIGTEPLGIFEELEQVGNLPRACQLESMPFDQVTKFLAFTSELASNPEFLFYLEAYRLTKAEARQGVIAAHTLGRDVFSVFESLVLRNRVLDHNRLKGRLEALLDQFRTRFGWQAFPALKWKS